MQNYSGEAGLQYHLQIRPGDVGRYVILPGDPKRCEKIARHFEDAKLVADSREFVTYTGTLDYDQLYEMIQNGTFPPDSKLPSETVLSAQLDVSRMTLRKALTFIQV